MWKRSCQVRRAQATQSSKMAGRSLMSSRATVSIVSSGWQPGSCRVFSLKPASSMYWLAASGSLVNWPSNPSLAQFSVCSIAWGKFFRVQLGMAISGASCSQL